jgi:hypothetical protein
MRCALQQTLIFGVCEQRGKLGSHVQLLLIKIQNDIEMRVRRMTSRVAHADYGTGRTAVHR